MSDKETNKGLDHDEPLLFDIGDVNKSGVDLHKSENIGNFNSYSYRRLAFDEILASLLISSEIRKKIKLPIKKEKNYNLKKSKSIISKLKYHLTDDQHKVINEINFDLSSKYKMFRLIQGDVGSGKTIVSLLSALNVIESGYQVAFMAPTEILANQHYNLSKKIFNKDTSIEIITGKTINKKKK